MYGRDHVGPSASNCRKKTFFHFFVELFSVVLTSFFVSKMFFWQTRQTEPEAKRRFSQTSEGRIRRQSAVVIEMTKEVHLHGDIWWHLETLKITLKIHDFRSTWDWPWKPGQVPIGDEDSLHPKVCTQIESLMPYAALMRFATGIFMHCIVFIPFLWGGRRGATQRGTTGVTFSAQRRRWNEYEIIWIQWSIQ